LFAYSQLDRIRLEAERVRHEEEVMRHQIEKEQEQLRQGLSLFLIFVFWGVV
jgi:hypothetical protein